MGSRICLLLLLLMGSSSVGDSIDDVLDGTLVGDIPLGELLASWDAVDCGGDRRALEAALGSAGRVHRALVEDWGFALVANAWDRRARAFTPAGADLLRTWLDGPDLARRRFFCEDGLPDTLRALAAADYPAAAAAHLASEARARAEVLATVPSPAAEVALLALLTLDGDLRARFDAQYPDHAEAAARVALGAALDAVDLEHIEPWDMGFSPRPGDPIEPVFPRIRYPKLGWGDIPDPADVAAAMRVAEAWARRRTAIVSDLRVARRRLADLATELARAPEGADLDRLGRSILRAEAGVSHALAELARHRAAVPHATTYRPVADSIVHHSLRPAEEDAIDLALAATRTAREEAVALAESAISKGADIPRRWAVAGARADEGGPGSTWTAGRVAAGPDPGLGDVSGDGATAPTAGGGALSYGDDGVRTYTGPLPTPSLLWSAKVVAAITTRHPNLDPLDARLLLELMGLAYPEFGSRARIEAAVFRALAGPRGLDLRGGEEGLSELGAGAAPPARVPVVLRLPTD